MAEHHGKRELMNGYDKLFKIIRQEGKRGSAGSPFYIGAVTDDGIEIAGVKFDREDLLFSSHLVDHENDVNLSWSTEVADLHSHSIAGNKKITVKSPLTAGDTVLCVRLDESSFAVIERLV